MGENVTGNGKRNTNGNDATYTFDYDQNLGARFLKINDPRICPFFLKYGKGKVKKVEITQSGKIHVT